MKKFILLFEIDAYIEKFKKNDMHLHSTYTITVVYLSF